MKYSEFFPYENFRYQQENIIRKVEKASKERKNILLVAPNGTGKTIIALSALLPIAYEENLKILYVCRTHAQNARIIKELNRVSKYIQSRNSKLKITGLSIRGRNEMCLNETLLSLKLGPKESMAVCFDLRVNRNCRYFINLTKRREDLENPINLAPDLFNRPVEAEDLMDFCKEKKICPYFLSKFLLKHMKLVICNYQWVFNPHIRNNFLQLIETDLSRCILVIDECHNLIDAATDINSKKISPYSMRLCLRDLEMYQSPPLMQEFLGMLINHLNKKKKNLKYEEQALDPQHFLNQINKRLEFKSLKEFENFIKDIHDFSVSIYKERIANGEISRDYVGAFAEFWLKWVEVYSRENYFFCYSNRKLGKSSSISLEIVALDPREVVIPVLKELYSTVNLSGTVNPYVYMNLMGLKRTGKEYKEINGDSIFKKENIKALIIDGVDTRKANRTSSMYKKMVGKIEEVIYSTPANIGIFCASYKILDALISNGIGSVAIKYNKKLFIEEPGLSASENSLLINDFKSMANQPNQGAILLGVCGGRNSEGEDYPGDFMNSVIIAGFPYHLPTPRVEAKIAYYNKAFNGNGWNLAYLYPAVQRANQASGRPIRKIKDKGALIFMDSRFKQKINWISPWIRSQIKVIPDRSNLITQELYDFWRI